MSADEAEWRGRGTCLGLPSAAGMQLCKGISRGLLRPTPSDSAQPGAVILPRSLADTCGTVVRSAPFGLEPPRGRGNAGSRELLDPLPVSWKDLSLDDFRCRI